jgi:hypothetical protein
LLAAGFLAWSAGTGIADGGRVLRAELSAFSEVPAISSLASGDFKLKISRDGTSVEYELSYENMQAPVLFAHIHLGQRDVNGGIMAFLCGGNTKPAPCPTPSGEVTGTVVAADIIGPAGQGVAAGEFAEFIRALRAGKAYANVHSQQFPGGEIRGQIRGHGFDHD